MRAGFGVQLAALCLASPLGAAAQDSIVLELAELSLELHPDFGTGRLRGKATLTLRNSGPAGVSSVPLLLNRLMRVTRVTEGRQALPVEQDVVVFSDDALLQVNAINVTLPRPVASGDSTHITVEYDGHLVGYTETGSLYIRDRIDSSFTIIREDAYAFPVLGRPSWRINRARARPGFRFRAEVTVPAGLEVAMGGQPVSIDAVSGLRVHTWESREPIPFLNITIAPYRVLENSGVRIYHFVSDSSGAARVDRAVTAALDRLAGWYGPLRSQVRLTIMEIPEGWGSQASLTAGIIQTADAFRSREQLRQLYHELTHLWNVPDQDLPSPRWNEGLAGFLQYRLASELDGWNEWETRLARIRQNLLSRCGEEARCRATPPEGYGRAGLTDFAYQTGLIMFYLLHRVMGPDRFDGAYRRYIRANPAGGTTVALTREFERVDPRARFVFDEWLRSTRWLERLESVAQPAALVEVYRQAR